MNLVNSISPEVQDQLQLEEIAVVDKISRKDFYNEFVGPQQPVLIKGMTEGWDALNWNGEYFRKQESGIQLNIKTGNVSEGLRKSMTLSEYIGLLETFEEELAAGESPDNPGYLHDVPFFNLYPEFLSDIEPFPVELFPKWYWNNWQNYIQFFMGRTGSLTPLHFDTLYTNNLFFQVVGTKRFLLIPANQKELCYISGWRWAKFNPDQPDFEKFPLAKSIKMMDVIVDAGDILYMPSGMLHQVHGMSQSISFNIDWHTTNTARKGIISGLEGAPKQNVYYNFILFLGLALGIPSKLLFPYYKSYLNYVS